MGFISLIILSFIVGILTGIPTAKYATPPSIPLLTAIISPWLFLYFFSENPTMNDIRNLYFSWVIGLFCYWTFFETRKKTKKKS